ncbi:retrovirus-related pol polyprotein from transposon TNT 1-94 [Tanacetum coccineum]
MFGGGCYVVAAGGAIGRFGGLVGWNAVCPPVWSARGSLWVGRGCGLEWCGDLVVGWLGVVCIVVIQLVLWIVDSGCSKHMTGNLQLLRNFIEKFMGTVRFGNDHFAAITGYGDYVQGNLTICHVYYVEGLGHNLFSVGQFCDGDLEVAFRSNTCYVQNLEGDDLLMGSRDSNLYTISISEMAASSPVCLMSRATSTKSWLWHRRLSHLNFGTINQLTSKYSVDGLPKLKYTKDHLCSAFKQGKSKKASLPPKLVPRTESKLELLHMDLCGPMKLKVSMARNIFS